MKKRFFIVSFLLLISIVFTGCSDEEINTVYTAAESISNAAKKGAEEVASQIMENSEVKQDVLEECIKVTESTMDEVTLSRIVDGDTICVVRDDGTEVKVRLIGIDTPESVNNDESKNNEYGVMASEHTKKLLEGVTKLYMSYDIQPMDQYGRALAYVWLSDSKDNIENNMLNAIVLRDGFAVNKEYKPNSEYAEIFSSICENAKANKYGLWQYEEFVTLASK